MVAATAQSRSCRLNDCALAGSPHEKSTNIVAEISRADIIIRRSKETRNVYWQALYSDRAINSFMISLVPP